MLDCLILGDSIAVGVGQIRTECVTHATSGINSYDYVNRHLYYTKGETTAKTVIISLGSNDAKNVKTQEELETLRLLVKADRVFWILPNIKDYKREQVEAVAKKYKDMIIDARQYDRSPDRVHPTYKGYRDIAKDTQ